MLGWALRFDNKVVRLTRQDANADKDVWLYFDYDPTEQLAAAKLRPLACSQEKQVIKVIGSGDTTTTIYDPNDVTKPYRFKEGTEAGQKAEIRRVMEDKFQKNNKAPWHVGVDVSNY